MAYDFQVTFDSADPHTQADWWAETLGWAVEPSDEAFIRKMVDEGFATEDDTTTYNGTLVWRTGAAIIGTGGAEGRRILFNLVPEPKTVKNRVHLDVRTDGEDLATVRERLEARGATFLYEERQGPHPWYTMRDPEGNEFCVS